MNSLANRLNPEDTQTMLAAALHDTHGADAELEAWTADPLSKRGKRRVVRYDLHVRLSGVPHLQRFQCVGKFYERDAEARRVAAMLRELAAAGCGDRGGFVVPSVLAHYEALLLLTYQSGESVTKAIARDGPDVLAAIGRALAVLHAAPVTPDRIADLCARFPAKAAALRRLLVGLEHHAPAVPETLSFLHGDLGLAQLLWSAGRIVILDFDDCTRGDPALDLGSLLTQLRRLTLRKPGKLPDLACLRRALLDAYQRWCSDDRGLTERVAWYEQIVLLRKIHTLEFDRTRHPEVEAIRERQAEAIRLLEELPVLVESVESPQVNPATAAESISSSCDIRPLRCSSPPPGGEGILRWTPNDAKMNRSHAT